MTERMCLLMNERHWAREKLGMLGLLIVCRLDDQNLLALEFSCTLRMQQFVVTVAQFVHLLL